jgi:peptidoglycan/LPS O-acetylase OafA/YrhL
MDNFDRNTIIRFWTAIGAYVVLILLSTWFLNRMDESNWRYLIAVLPVAPTAVAGIALVNGIRQLDELQRRIHSEAAVISAVATALITFSYGLLENAGLPSLSVIFVLPLMVMIWGVTNQTISRRYK